jgi:hypothetical protein
MTTGFTIEVWIKPSQQLSSQRFVVGQAYGRQLVLQPGSGGLVNAVMYLTTTNGTFVGTTPVSIPVGQYTHVAATYDAAFLKLYTNGVLARTSAYSGGLGDSFCAWGFGGLTSACGFSGQYLPSGSEIDEVSLYNRALLAGEINAIYLAGAAGKCKTPQSCAPGPFNIAASWPGEGDASDMVNTCPGTLQNGVGFDQGIVARAFTFNPTNQQAVEMTSLSSVLTSPFSLEAWIKPLSKLGGSPQQGWILGQSYSSQLVVTNGLQGLRVGFALASSRTLFQEVLSSGDIPLREWSHLLAVYDGTAMSLYINGALDQQAAANITPWDSGCPFHLGGIYDPSGDCAYTGQFFNGLIDEATVYSQALSAADVAALYNAGEMGKCSSLGYWLQYYFGPDCWNETYATAPANADDQYDTNFGDYLAGRDPNYILFRASFPNDHVNGNSVNATVVTQAGIPYQMAALTNSTNFASAAWVPYNPTLPVSLGSTDGRYNVWIGLKGYAANSVETWQGYDILRDTVPPAIHITNPVVTTVSRPVLQLQGYSEEPLAGITYDLANAAGTVTGLEGYLMDQWFDTNSLAFTTNWFECLDIPLTNGDNTITLHATDLAGNTTTSVRTYTLDYTGVTAPALTLYWPQNGAVVSGTSFTLRGLLDDPTATVSAQITDGNGVTSQADGLVERNGLLWIENLPLGPGANTLTLSMTNAIGQFSIVSLTVTQSDVALTIGNLSNQDLNQPFIYVSGSIDAEGYTVWVNGVQATPYGDGTWGAVNVPVCEGGTAVIQARAIPSSEGGTGKTVSTMADPGNPSSPQARDAEADPDKPPIVVQVHYDKMLTDSSVSQPPSSVPGVVHEDILWDLGMPGHWWWDDCYGPSNDEYFKCDDAWWDWSGTGMSSGGIRRGPGVCGVRTYDSTGPYAAPSAWPGEFCKVSAHRSLPAENGQVSTQDRSRAARTRYMLHTGGKGISTRQNLFVLTAQVQGVGDPFWPEVDAVDDCAYSVLPTSITMGDCGQLGNDALLYKVLADNTIRNITPTVTGNTYYTFQQLAVSKHKLKPLANGQDCQTGFAFNAPTFIVGQFVTFQSAWDQNSPYAGDPPAIDIQTNKWTLAGHYYNDSSNSVPGVDWPTCSKSYFVNQNMLTNDPTTNPDWWVSGGTDYPDSYSVKLDKGLFFNNGQYVSLHPEGRIDMRKPNAEIIAQTTEVNVIGSTLIFGESTTSAPYGITFTCSFPQNQGFGGVLGWVQVTYQPVRTALDDLGRYWDLIQPNPGPWLDQPTQADPSGDEYGGGRPQHRRLSQPTMDGRRTVRPA